MADDLFSASIDPASMPLAARMRPTSLDDVVGQGHLLGAGSPLRRLLEDVEGGGSAQSVMLWGPPGTGKTTLAWLLAGENRRFVEVSAVSSGIKDIRAAIEGAKHALTSGRRTVLFVDEVHRFSRTQQDALLPAVESGWVILVAATTENPAHSVVSPLLSRSLVLALEPLSDADIEGLVQRALRDPRGFDGRLSIDGAALELLVRMAGGDARRALTITEAAAGAAGDEGGDTITGDHLERTVDRAMVRYDRAGDQHYDVISAFIKSIRGSDVDAALHYLARMIDAGEDPRFIARRLVILASEDIGMADPTALQTAVAAADAVAFIGLPEGRLPLAQATIALALAPKSNSVITAIDAAIADVRAGLAGPVPLHLRDAHHSGSRALGHGRGYRYPHDEPEGVSPQVYAPESLVGRGYYTPSRFGAEPRQREVMAKITSLLRRDGGSTDSEQ